MTRANTLLAIENQTAFCSCISPLLVVLMAIYGLRLILICLLYSRRRDKSVVIFSAATERPPPPRAAKRIKTWQDIEAMQAQTFSLKPQKDSNVKKISVEQSAMDDFVG